MNPKIKQQIEEEALRRFPEDEYNDEYFTERYYFKEGAEYGYNIKESVNEKLVEALKESIKAINYALQCTTPDDEDYQTFHDTLMNRKTQAEEALLSASNQENDEGDKCQHTASERIGETKLWCCNICGKRIENF